MPRGNGSLRPQCEHCASISGSAIACCSVKHPAATDDQTCKWISPLAAAGKAVQHGFRPGLTGRGWWLLCRNRKPNFAVARGAVEHSADADCEACVRLSPVAWSGRAGPVTNRSSTAPRGALFLGRGVSEKDRSPARIHVTAYSE
jgi:hypothetical protein